VFLKHQVNHCASIRLYSTTLNSLLGAGHRRGTIMIYLYKKARASRKQRLQTATPEDSNDGAAHELQTRAESHAQSSVALGNAVETSAKRKEPLTPEEKAEKKRRTIYRWKLVLGLFGPFALQALDTTIIASALARIAQDFRQSKPSCSAALWLIFILQTRLTN
jgi:hypothetical protein